MTGLLFSNTARRRPAEQDPAQGLAPLGAPMAVSGLGAAATRMLADQLGLIPARGGANGSNLPAPAQKIWKGGDAVSVVLIRGDNAVSPNGTITWVGGKQGERLLGFGHEMFGAGPSNLPIADARVHVIIPSVERSVKLSSALAVRGTLIQDRQAGISLRTDLTAPLIPVTTELRGPEAAMPARTYKSEVALGVDLTPSLTASLLTDALAEGSSDGAELVARVEYEIAVTTSKGPRTLRISDEQFFADGVKKAAIIKRLELTFKISVSAVKILGKTSLNQANTIAKKPMQSNTNITAIFAARFVSCLFFSAAKLLTRIVPALLSPLANIYVPDANVIECHAHLWLLFQTYLP